MMVWLFYAKLWSLTPSLYAFFGSKADLGFDRQSAEFTVIFDSRIDLLYLTR